MWSRKVIAAALLAAGIIGPAAFPTPALAEVNVQLNFAPPPPRYEAVPPPRPGYVWSQGYWHWDGRRHVWRTGHWVAERPGYVYHAPRWVERDGRWHYAESRWDRDGDGIPNRYDRTPNGNPRWDRDGDGIPNNRDRTPDGNPRWDRDGDGVPNRYDARPDNPYRH